KKPHLDIVENKGNPPTEQARLSENTGVGNFPSTRMRRLRHNQSIRTLVEENRLSIHDLILPIFVEEKTSERSPIASLPGIYRETEKTLENALKDAGKNGIKTVILFGISHNKDAQGN